MQTTQMIKFGRPKDAEILHQFSLLPRVYRGKEIRISFRNKANFQRFRNTGILVALELPLGATISETLRVGERGDYLWVFAHGDLARKVLSLPKGAQVDARVRTLYGVVERVNFSCEGAKIEREEATGLLIVELLNVPPAVIH
ncbi:hypothetical protein ACFL96_18270 [Thermoproteota archaeon]